MVSAQRLVQALVLGLERCVLAFQAERQGIVRSILSLNRVGAHSQHLVNPPDVKREVRHGRGLGFIGNRPIKQLPQVIIA